jgi:hypothetical protein
MRGEAGNGRRASPTGDAGLLCLLHRDRPALGDLAGLAAALKLPERELAAQGQVVVAVRHWLQRHDRWLLVVDNAKGPHRPLDQRAARRAGPREGQVVAQEVLMSRHDSGTGHTSGRANATDDAGC